MGDRQAQHAQRVGIEAAHHALEGCLGLFDPVVGERSERIVQPVPLVMPPSRMQGRDDGDDHGKHSSPKPTARPPLARCKGLCAVQGQGDAGYLRRKAGVSKSSLPALLVNGLRTTGCRLDSPLAMRRK